MAEQPLIARWALGSLGLFVLIAVVEDAAQSRLSPLTHQVSEYANDARLGWLMTIGFASWALSLVLTSLVAVRPSPRRSRTDVIIAALLLCAGVAMVLTTLFHTQTVEGALPPRRRLTASGRLHDIGSGVTTVSLFLAALTASVSRVRQHNSFVRLSACAVVSSIIVDGGLLLAGSSVGGLRERILLLIGCTWQGALLVRAAVAQNRRGPQRPTGAHGADAACPSRPARP